MAETAAYGGIEAGGTKFVCAAGTGPDDVRGWERIETRTPRETLAEVIEFFREHPAAGLGIGSFGPLDLDLASPTYGSITTTPKDEWRNTDLAGPLREALDLPVTLDTDVNAAALGELTWGAGRGLKNLVYLTVGTGIGGGAVVNGELLHGRTHPEMGHLLLPHDLERDPFPGCCPYHGDCWEGLASGEAMRLRWDRPAEDLPADHPAWKLEAEYLAAGIMDLVVTLSPERVVVGGGVGTAPGLLAAVREKLSMLLNDYAAFPSTTPDMNDFLVPPGLGDRSGVLGALALAIKADADRE
jgi:fructokinase